MTHSFRYGFAGCVAATVISASPCSASLHVFPVIIEMPAGTSIAKLTVSNAGDQSTSVRVKAFRWVQRDGENVLEETQDVIASPPIFSIAPGKGQILRLGLRKAGDTSAYRLMVEEIPAPKPIEGISIRMALRLSLPVYTGVAADAAPQTSWATTRLADGGVELIGRNAGNRRARISKIEAVTAEGERIILSDAPGAILPDSYIRWRFPNNPKLAAAKSPLQLSIWEEGGEKQTPVPLLQP